MSGDLVTAHLPLKIFVSGNIIQHVEDAEGHPIESEVWDTDTEGLEENDPQIKTDEEGKEHHVYYP